MRKSKIARRVARALALAFPAVDGDEITGIEGGHFAKVTFNPSSLATVTDVTDQHFHKTVTAQGDVGGGTVARIFEESRTWRNWQTRRT